MEALETDTFELRKKRLHVEEGTYIPVRKMLDD